MRILFVYKCIQGDIMNQKEEEILEEIVSYYNKNKAMPTFRYLQKGFNFKSVNSITRYIKSLEQQHYLIRNNNNKVILSEYSGNNTNLKTINVINMNNKYINIILNKNKKYLAYKINNNYFNNMGILKNDILVIEINKRLKPSDLGLFIIDKKYRIMKYNYKDGFYLLSDNEEILLNKVNIIGKVIMIERKL